MTAEQIALPTLEWPALVAGRDVFLCFEIEGKPGHKARHRSRLVIPRDAWVHTQRDSYIPKANAKKIFIQQYPDPATEAYEKTLREVASLFMRGRTPTERPVTLLVHAFLPIPVSWTKTEKARALAGNLLPTSRPDDDNYLKIRDALDGVVWKEDSQCCDSRVIKRYSDQPALRIEVREMVEP